MANIKFRKRSLTGGGITLDLVIDGTSPDIYDVATAGQYDHRFDITTQGSRAVGTVAPENVTVIQNPDNTDIVVPLENAVYTTGDATELLTGAEFRNTPWNVKMSLNDWYGEIISEPIPEDPTGYMAIAHAAVVNDIVYVQGGYDPGIGWYSTKMRSFNRGTGVWTPLAEAPYATFRSVVAVRGSEIFIAGHGVAMKYNTSTNTWTTLANMPFYRREVCGGFIGDYLYVYGGSDSGGTAQYNSVIRYNPIANTWSSGFSVPIGRQGITTSSGIVYGGKLYVHGGLQVIGGTNYESKQLHVYDPVANTWERKADSIYGRYGSAIEAMNGKIYILGGGPASWTPPNVAYNTIQEYDIASDSWSIHPSTLPVALVYASTIRYSNNDVLIGYGYDNMGVDRSEMYQLAGI